MMSYLLTIELVCVNLLNSRMYIGASSGSSAASSWNRRSAVGNNSQPTTLNQLKWTFGALNARQFLSRRSQKQALSRGTKRINMEEIQKPIKIEL
jgi:hypothetical protein